MDLLKCAKLIQNSPEDGQLRSSFFSVSASGIPMIDCSRFRSTLSESLKCVEEIHKIRKDKLK